MEKDVKKITKFIDNYLETHQMEYITPPEANELLAEAGLLDDSESRSGITSSESTETLRECACGCRIPSVP